jgi:hypothetical protein
LAEKSDNLPHGSRITDAPQARADFVMSEIKRGINKIDYIEQSAPKISDG